MGQKKRAAWTKFTLRLLRPLIHIGLVGVSFWAAYLVRQKIDFLDIPSIIVKELIVFAGISIVIFIIINFSANLYSLSKPLHGYGAKFFRSRGLWFVSSTFLALFGQGLIFGQGISRFILLFSSAATWLLITIFDLFWNAWNSYLESKHPYKMLAVYETQEILDEFLDEFADYPIYDIRAILVSDYDDNRNRESIDLVVMLGTFEQDMLQNIADHARLEGKTLYHVPESYFLEDLVAVSTRLGPVVGLEYKASPLEGWYRVWKRFFDFFGSLLVIIALSPVLILLALLIKITSRGPIFFTQKRVGRKAEEFNFIKFRSMYTQFCTGESYGGIDAERLYRKLIKKRNTRDDILPKIENDPRVTPLGRFMRKTSLDELPNLFCVLLGTMSFVGPRPHMPNEVDKYEPWMERLFAVKPGVTGYAQIFGRDRLPFEQEAKLDLYYIQNWSFAMDIQVLFSTLKVVFGGR